MEELLHVRGQKVNDLLSLEYIHLCMKRSFEISDKRKTNVISTMCPYFMGMAGNNNRAGALLCELACIEAFTDAFSSETCDKFKTWFTKVNPVEGKLHEEAFQRLCRSNDDFLDLSLFLYDGPCRLPSDQLIQLRCESVNWFMDRNLAMAESVVLKDLINLTGGHGQIPVPGVSSGYVLSLIIDFCQKKHDFLKVIKSLMGHYKSWVTGFLATNRAVLGDLHKAADFLHIPSLLTLTSHAMTDLMENAFEGISEWCGKLSTSRVISSFWAGAGEDIHVPDQFYFD